MADFSMGYNSVTGLAEEVVTIQKNYEATLSGMDALIKSLDGQWEGAAQKEFMTAYNKLKPRLKTVSATLKRYTDSLGKAVSYELKADKQSSLSFTSF